MLDISAPISFSMSIATIIVAMFALRKNIQCCIALVVSLISARYLTVIGHAELHAQFMFVCAFISVTSFQSFKFGFLEIEKNEVNYTVAFIYMVRMALVLAMVFRIIDEELMWLLSIFFLFLQIVIIAGSCIDADRVNRNINHVRISCHDLLFSKKRRDI